MFSFLIFFWFDPSETEGFFMPSKNIFIFFLKKFAQLVFVCIFVKH